jgi:hypothetical protein
LGCYKGILGFSEIKVAYQMANFGPSDPKAGQDRVIKFSIYNKFLFLDTICKRS